ncbi:MAG: hypothetical protein J0I06_26190 [Planctomycetes bacterium]|nr:hypothetical protein [Planctomycetota bacterium]
MNPDPVAKLARFTPAPADPAELLFAAGRASARTHWLWKVAVAALVASNASLSALLALRSTSEPASPNPVPIVAPAPEPSPVPSAPPSSAPVDDPWSYRALRGSDLERAPRPEAFTAPAPREPLTVLSGRRGEID